jgi:hypothetical protein
MVGYLGGQTGFENVSARMLHRLASGFSLWAPTGQALLDPDVQAVLMLGDYRVLCAKVANFMQQNCSSSATAHMRRSPVVAAMLETFKKAPIKAEEFWLAVGNSVGFSSAYDPRLVLRNELNRHALQARTTSVTTQGRSVSVEKMYQWCIYAWNAWREGRELKVLSARSLTSGKRPVAKA